MPHSLALLLGVDQSAHLNKFVCWLCQKNLYFLIQQKWTFSEKKTHLPALGQALHGISEEFHLFKQKIILKPISEIREHVFNFII